MAAKDAFDNYIMTAPAGYRYRSRKALIKVHQGRPAHSPVVNRLLKKPYWISLGIVCKMAALLAMMRISL